MTTTSKFFVLTILAITYALVVNFLAENDPNRISTNVPVAQATEQPAAPPERAPPTHVITEHEQCIDFVKQWFDADVARKAGTAKDYKMAAADTGFSWPMYRGMMLSIITSEQCGK